MARSDSEERELFRERYSVSGTDALIAAELEVLGSDYQANGYTTMAQADELGHLLGLKPSTRLLDIGAGCGWPGLYLANKHRCALVSTDPVDEGLRTSSERARSEQIRSHGAIVAPGAPLPFKARSFDAVVHTDVTC